VRECERLFLSESANARIGRYVLNHSVSGGCVKKQRDPFLPSWGSPFVRVFDFVEDDEMIYSFPFSSREGERANTKGISELFTFFYGRYQD